jgi:phenylacetate-CoA ligase
MGDLLWRLRAAGAAARRPRWTRERLDHFQSECLRRLVRHAGARVPYYRDLFRRHGLAPEDIRGVKDLARLPLAHRSEMQERPAPDLVARGYDPERLRTHRTSGSTGAPFTIRRTWFEERLLQALRFHEEWNVGLRLTDIRSGVVAQRRPRAERWYNRLGLLRRVNVDCLLPARDILHRLGEIQPDVLGGYGGSLAWLAGEATPEDRQRIRPRLMFAGAETLTPEMRRQITECFGAPLYDAYASHEFNLIAFQCGETGLYHISELSVIAEVLKDGQPVGPGETGELVGTALHSYAMPFLRYPLGDVVTRGPAPCPCGGPLATLASIQGRVADRFLLPDGSSLHPYWFVTPLVQDSPWLRRYQIVQTGIDRIAVKAVPLQGASPTPDDLARIRSEIERIARGGVTVVVELATELPLGPSGKFRPYYSLVAGR